MKVDFCEKFAVLFIILLSRETWAMQIDRNEDMIRSCLRAVDAVSRIHNIETSASFKNLMTNTVSRGPLQEKLKIIREERAEAEGTASSSGAV